MQDFYSTLFSLKKEQPALWSGNTGGKTTNLERPHNNEVVLYKRSINGTRFYIALNLAPDEKTVTLTLENSSRELFNGKQFSLNDLDEIDQRLLNKITSPLKKLMRLGLPDSEYCSTVSTTLLDCTDYFFIKRFLIQEGLWDDKYQQIENGLKSIAYINSNKINELESKIENCADQK